MAAYSYYGQHLDPRIVPQRPDLVATRLRRTTAELHVAPLGRHVHRHRSPENTTAGVRRRTRKLNRTPLNG